MNFNKKFNFAVCQIGARMHYAVPRIFQEAGALECLYTDICAVKGWPRLLNLIPSSLKGNAVKRLLGRVPEGVPVEKIEAFNWIGLKSAVLLAMSRDFHSRTDVYLRIAKEFNKAIIRTRFKQADAIYCFGAGCLELVLEAKKQGVFSAAEQMLAPRQIVRDLLAVEFQSFPDWEKEVEDKIFDPIVIERENLVWKNADRVICGSQFVADGISKCGGPANKCAVVPYGVDICMDEEVVRRAIDERVKRRKKHDPLRVITVGSVCLRKGSPYVLEAAKKLHGRAQFKMVGGVDVSNAASDELCKHVDLTGLVPRSETRKHYEWADVFLLPSICEGSATVTYEAMAYGLPVICTHNTGSVVQHEKDGLIIPASNSEAIVSALGRLSDKPDEYEMMCENALVSSTQNDVAHYGKRLLNSLVANQLK